MWQRSWQTVWASVAAVLLLAAWSQRATAGIFSDLFGVEKGLVSLGGSAVEASANMRDVTNQFGGLVADLYGGDDKAKTRARGILNGVLGRESNAVVPQVGLSVTVVGRSTTPLPLQVAMWPAMDTRDEWVKLRVEADGIASLTFKSLNTTVLLPPTPKEMREQLSKRLQEIHGTYNEKRQGCPRESSGGGLNPACILQVERDREVELQLVALERPVVNSPKNFATFLVPGGIYGAIIAPKAELDAVMSAHGSEAELQAWVHNYSQPSERTPAFATSNWKVRVSDWQKRCIDTKATGVGQVCYAFVDFGLLSINDYVSYMKELAARAKR